MNSSKTPIHDFSSSTYGNVFNIQQFTVHDGPGIRTEIFLKGCPLRCRWCSNPESFLLESQIGIYPTRCIGIKKCGKCIEVCQNHGKNAIKTKSDTISSIDRSICDNCLLCFDVCPTSALKRWGEKMSVKEVMDVIISDKHYYDKSNGGVTISGGESLLQWGFTKEVLKACKNNGINTCVETALHVDEKILSEILPHTDLIITDIKHMDNSVHKEYTQVENIKILKNIEEVVNRGIPVVLRVPVIPEVNDSKKHIAQIADFILNTLNNRLKQVQLLRYRPLGEEKYASLGLPYRMPKSKTDRKKSEADIKELVKILTKNNIPAFAGTTNKIVL